MLQGADGRVQAVIAQALGFETVERAAGDQISKNAADLGWSVSDCDSITFRTLWAGLLVGLFFVH
ncbi:hypothetical protein UB43_21020 [Pseudomonas sp. 21]|nr:hypothetical protein UB43_21020 [Pseudomonas sp. 21]